MIVNPTHWAGHGRLPAMIDAIDAGLAEAEQDGLPPVGFRISVLRTQSAGVSAELVGALVALRHPRVVALSIDGNEAAAGSILARLDGPVGDSVRPSNATSTVKGRTTRGKTEEDQSCG